MEVSIRGVLEARKKVYEFLKPTPLIRYPLLSRQLECEFYVKHENHLPTGAFKIRGGLNLIGNLSPAEKARGVITATRGNHGQSIALACQIHSVRCVVGIPEGNNPEKNEAMEAFGAELLIHGRDFDEAREKVEEVQSSSGMRYVHSGNEPLLIHGVGTYALELLQDLPDVDYIFVPIGGGSGASGILTVVRSMVAGVKVVGVQAEQAPAFYRSWKSGVPVATDSADTIADGLATRGIFELPFSIIKRSIDDVITVSEEEFRWAVFELLRSTHQLAEPAGAAGLAGAARFRKQIRGKKVVMILTGCNIASAVLNGILAQFASQE